MQFNWTTCEVNGFGKKKNYEKYFYKYYSVIISMCWKFKNWCDLNDLRWKGESFRKHREKEEAKNERVFLWDMKRGENNKKKGYYSWINCVEGVRAMHTKRLRGKTNYSNGLQCLYLPCKWCIQRIV